jgi:hypothetical protein
MPIHIRGLRLPAKLRSHIVVPEVPEIEKIPEVTIPVYTPYVSAQEDTDEEIEVPKLPKTNVKNRQVTLNPLSN